MACLPLRCGVWLPLRRMLDDCSEQNRMCSCPQTVLLPIRATPRPLYTWVGEKCGFPSGPEWKLSSGESECPFPPSAEQLSPRVNALHLFRRLFSLPLWLAHPLSRDVFSLPSYFTTLKWGSTWYAASEKRASLSAVEDGPLPHNQLWTSPPVSLVTQ